MPGAIAEQLPQTHTPNKWMVLFTVAFGTFMATLDSSIVNIALPTIRRELAKQLA